MNHIIDACVKNVYLFLGMNLFTELKKFVAQIHGGIRNMFYINTAANSGRYCHTQIEFNKYQ